VEIYNFLQQFQETSIIGFTLRVKILFAMSFFMMLTSPFLAVF